LFERRWLRQLVDGRRLTHTAKFSTDGLAGALASLIETCPPVSQQRVSAIK